MCSYGKDRELNSTMRVSRQGKKQRMQKRTHRDASARTMDRSILNADLGLQASDGRDQAAGAANLDGLQSSLLFTLNP